MPLTLDTVATEDIVRDLADVVAVKPDGTRWKASSVKQLQRSCTGLLGAPSPSRHVATL